MNDFRTAMQSIETKDQFDAFNVEFDPEDILGGSEPEGRAAFFIANLLLCGGVDDADTYVDYVRLMEKFYPDINECEGYGGCNFNNPQECLLDTLRFNLQEHTSYTDEVPYWEDTVFVAIYEACLKLGMPLPPTIREWWSN